MKQPLVSCLCVTHHPVEFLRKAVAYFEAQTYPAKELVIVHTDDRTDLMEYAQSLQRDDILHLHIPVDLPLTFGAKRNLAIEKSNGVYFCTWDDDDWMHPQRLDWQLQQLVDTGTHANVFANIILYDGLKGRAYLSARRAWEQTLFCQRHISPLQIFYADQDRGEDSPLLAALLEAGVVSYSEQPHGYIYQYHHNNVTGYKHWQQAILPYAMSLPDEISRVVAEVVTAQHYSSEAAARLDKLLG